MAMTAPTPMMIPIMVRIERILLRAKARIAIRMIASKSMFIQSRLAQSSARSVLKCGQVLDDFRCLRPVQDGLIATNLSVTKLNAAFSKLCDVRLVRHQHKRQALIVQFLENIHD